MILKYFYISLLLGSALMAQSTPPTGTWRQANITWKKPPAELELKQRYAEAAVLYFSSDQKFLLLYGTVIQGSKSEEISQGDGRIIYLGTWKLTGNSLHVEYRLVSRTIAKDGETLPGRVQNQDLRLKDGTLLFQRHRFRRDEKLDNELKVILNGEDARRKKQGGSP